MGHRLWILLFGFAKWALPAPAHSSKDTPNMSTMIMNPTGPVDYLRDAVKCPQLGGKSMGQRPFQQGSLYFPERSLFQAGFSSRTASSLQSSTAFALPSLIPPASGLSAHFEPANHFGLRLTLTKQFGCFEPTGFQGLEIPSRTDGWVHDNIQQPTHENVTILYETQ